MLSLTVLKKNPSLGQFVLPTPIFATTSNAGFRRETDKTWRDYVNTWIDFNKGLGFIRNAIITNMELVGVTEADIPPGVRCKVSQTWGSLDPRAPLHSLSRLRERVGVRVSPLGRLPKRMEPSPGASRRPLPQAGEVQRARGSNFPSHLATEVRNSMYQWDFGILWSYRWLFLNGLGVTVGFTVVIVVLGLVFGLFGAFGSLSRFKAVRLIALTFIEAFRCTPILVQLIWFYYALPILAGVEMTPITASALALSLYGGSFYSEIIRGGIISIDRGQSEAGAALGMTPGQAMRRIVLPQAIKRMIPALMNQSIIQFKNTSLVSVLAVPDLVYQSQVAAHDSYRPLETYTAVAVAYAAILIP